MFSHALDMKSGPLPPGGWDDSRQDSVGGEGDREVLLGDVGPGDFPKAPRSYRAELSSILLLLFLYVLQGIPLDLRGRATGREQQMQRGSVEDCAEGEMFRDEKDCVCLCTCACVCI